MFETVHQVSHFLTGVGRGDNVDAAEKCICLLYELKKMVSWVLILPGIVFCESEI